MLSESQVSRPAPYLSLIDKLRCPLSGRPLRIEGNEYVSVDGRHRYATTDSGIPLFAEQFCSEDARRQRDHYQKVAETYLKNLEYPHTQMYMGYLDEVFRKHVRESDLTEAAEICCGQGELLTLFGPRVGCGIGVDISPAMLEAAKLKHREPSNFLFVQGDATALPLADAHFSGVFMFGGIHHVSDRQRLFEEVFRILRPGGCFYFREPISDFFLWRWIRAIIYRLSPALDAETERPLLWRETVPLLENAGFELKSWDTCGFLGFCFFMNSDVLIFNRLFRFLPGIRFLTRVWTRIDDLTLRIPGLHRVGLQVVGVAQKPARQNI